MRKVRKICCEITPRRAIAAVLVAATVVNLVIVGAVFDASASLAVPTSIDTQMIYPATLTFIVSTATGNGNAVITFVPTKLSTHTATFTPTDTPTSTFTATPTPTVTDTPPPTPTTCVPRYSWLIYIVEPGDTLSELAVATRSSVSELMLANCLLSTRILAGQILYVPRLPIAPPSITPTVWVNTPTDFQNAFACAIPGTLAVSFFVTPYDPEGISTLTASYNIYGGQVQSDADLKPVGNGYSGSGYQDGQYPAAASIAFHFIATDSQGYVTKSVEYSTTLEYCRGG